MTMTGPVFLITKLLTLFLLAFGVAIVLAPVLINLL